MKSHTILTDSLTVAGHCGDDFWNTEVYKLKSHFKNDQPFSIPLNMFG